MDARSREQRHRFCSACVSASAASERKSVLRRRRQKRAPAGASTRAPRKRAMSQLLFKARSSRRGESRENRTYATGASLLLGDTVCRSRLKGLFWQLLILPFLYVATPQAG